MESPVYRIAKLAFDIGGKLYNEAICLFFSNEPFPEASKFPVIQKLEVNQDKIQAEFKQVYERETIPQIDQIFVEQSPLNKKKTWRFLVLKSFFSDFGLNTKKFPLTTEIISDKIVCSAFFSILSPKSNIPPHRGPFKGVIRVHLPLLIPQDHQNCYIVVGGIKRYWEKAKCLVFDDYFEHYVINDTDQVRVVLFLDIVRPLPFPFSMINKAILRFIGNSVFMKNLRKKAEAFHKK